MSVGLLEPRPVAKKTGDTTIRVSMELADLLRQVTALKKVSIGEYLDTTVTATVRRDLLNEARKITKGTKPPKPDARE